MGAFTNLGVLWRRRLGRSPRLGWRPGWRLGLRLGLPLGLWFGVHSLLACSLPSARVILAEPAGAASSSSIGVSLPAPAMPGRNVAAIHVNTVGYPRRWRSLAMFTVDPAKARLWRIASGWGAARPSRAAPRVVDSGWRPSWQTITQKGTDDASGDPVWVVDLSAYRPKAASNDYYVLAAGMTQREVESALGGDERRLSISAPFQFTSSVYPKLAQGLLTSLYQQRCHSSLGSKASTCDGRHDDAASTRTAHLALQGFSRSQPCHCAPLNPLCAAPQAASQAWAMGCVDSTVEPAGGWHHGAGFGVYMASLAPTVQALATVALRAPDLFGVGPDSPLLAELRYGLRWIERMQYRPDSNDAKSAAEMDLAGGFYAFETPWGSASPKGSAAADNRSRYYGPIASNTSAKATAALATAARLYRELGRGCRGSHCADWRRLAERSASAAASGFSFLTKHPRKMAVTVSGHGHPLWDDAAAYGHDDGVRLNAAVQVWALTGDNEVLEAVKRYAARPQASGERLLDGSWANPARWALATLADCRANTRGCSDGFVRTQKGEQRAGSRAAPPYPDLAAEAQRRLFVAAMQLRDHIEDEDGYRVASRPEDYVWGHNARLMEKASVLAHAAQHYRRLVVRRAQLDRAPAAPELEQLEIRLRAMADANRLPDQAAPQTIDLAWTLEASRDQWHWLLGRNPNGHCMITGFGRAPTTMVHREWSSPGALAPGYLLGGPNARQLGFLAPEAPAKALLLEHAGRLWQTDRALLGEHAADPNADWSAVAEGSIYYTATALLTLAELYRTRSWSADSLR